MCKELTLGPRDPPGPQGPQIAGDVRSARVLDPPVDVSGMHMDSRYPGKASRLPDEQKHSVVQHLDFNELNRAD